MIICGFPGVGKSTLARNSNWIDLESTPFAKNWEIYANVAQHMLRQGYNVLVSTHSGLREELERREIPYCVVVPYFFELNTYLKNYENRGNSKDFIQTVRNNWDSWLSEIFNRKSEFCSIIVLPYGRYLTDVVERLDIGYGSKNLLGGEC